MLVSSIVFPIFEGVGLKLEIDRNMVREYVFTWNELKSPGSKKSHHKSSYIFSLRNPGEVLKSLMIGEQMLSVIFLINKKKNSE